MAVNNICSHNNQNFALILAAGFSTRMGVCKTTLPWRNDRTLLHYQAEQFLQAGIVPIVVLGSHNADRRSDLPHGSLVTINHNSDRGKTSSILTGLNLLPDSFLTITISAVDQPRSSDVYRALLTAYYEAKASIVAPYNGESLGHPLLFSERLLPELKNIKDSSFGLREVVQRFYSKIEKVNIENADISSDLNNPTIYQLELQKIKVIR